MCVFIRKRRTVEVNRSGIGRRVEMAQIQAGGETVLELTEFRHQFAETITRVGFGKERVTLTRHGKAVVALVPIEDLELLEALEDRIDLEKTRAALEEARAEGTLPWEQVKAELGL
jgi:prevent-host-death family protein